MSSLKAALLTIDQLTAEDQQQMFAVFEKYYAGALFQTFLQDLAKKHKVIVLREQRTGRIQGFSTIMEYTFTLGAKSIRGVFSGDTIIEKKYWGGSALQVAFTRYLTLSKLKDPFTDYYWFLICKGYKTYLLLANNFIDYYPRADRATPPDHQAIMHQFARSLYPEHYNAETGIIHFPKADHDYLKCDVAPITQEMLKNSPKIAFFMGANPHWQRGDELVCLGRFDALIPWRMFKKTLRKMLAPVLAKLTFRPAPSQSLERTE